MRELSEQLKTIQGNITRAALFIDIDNLYDHLQNRLNGNSFSDTVLQIVEDVGEMVAEVGADPVLKKAVGSGDTFLEDSGLFTELATRGIESLVAGTDDVTGLQLGVNAVETGLLFPEIDLFIIVTGGRKYQPVADHLRRRGREFLLVSFADSGARDFNTTTASAIGAVALSNNGYQKPQGATKPARTTRFSEIHHIPDGFCRDALWVIEEFFGQYDEIYLTPLLRRLSEELDDLGEYDPKTVVSDLELAGAARLEKRKGEPYDYTVLILNDEHPDVIAIRREYQDRPDEEPGSDYEQDGVSEGDWDDEYETDGGADAGVNY